MSSVADGAVPSVLGRLNHDQRERHDRCMCVRVCECVYVCASVGWTKASERNTLALCVRVCVYVQVHLLPKGTW